MISAPLNQNYFAACFEAVRGARSRSIFCSLQFSSLCGVDRELEWIKIIVHSSSLAAGYSNSRGSLNRLINTRAQVCLHGLFCWLIYSLGLRISEGLALRSVPTIDGSQRRVHNSRWPRAQRSLRSDCRRWTLEAMRRFWTNHRHPRCCSSRPASQFHRRGSPVARWMPAA